MKKLIKNLLLIGMLLWGAVLPAQVVLLALDAPGFRATKTETAGKTFYRNNCGYGYTGGSRYVSRTATATATSAISQADAESKASTQAYNEALARVNAEGQNEANTYGTCTANTYTATKTETAGKIFYRNNCGYGYTGGSRYVSRTATATATSTISQSDANSKASTQAYNNALAKVNAEGQNEANTYGTCTYNGGGGGGGGTIYTATKTASYSGTFTKNNCPAGQTGTQVTYTTPTYTETRTSTVSQADANNLAQNAANAKAQADLNANGQTYANNNGRCTVRYFCSETVYKKMMPVCTPQTIILSQRTYYSNRDESVREQMISTFFAQCENINDTSGRDVGWVAKDVTCTAQ